MPSRNLPSFVLPLSIFLCFVLFLSALSPSGQASPLPQISGTPLFLPLIAREGGATEWSQHAHDAMRTSYTIQTVPPPWRLRWIWNGATASGGIAKVTQKGSLPRNVQPVTGGGRVYIAAEGDGVYALSESTGQTLWQRGGIGDVRSTAAYDAATQAVFVVSSNGRLYKLRASDGAILGSFNSNQTSGLPLPPAVLSDRVLFAMGNAVFAVDKQTLQPLWTYNAGSGLTVAVPPAYSPSRNVVSVATEPDLYVHAINNQDGSRKWRVRPVDSRRRFEDPTEYRYGWPVIADGAGYVLVKARLPWSLMWTPWPQTNPEIRQFLTNNPGHQALFVLDLDDGSVPYIANVAHGGYGDNDDLPMGPQPVVKRLPNGKEVVYIIVRATHAYPPEWNWDSHFGEMALDDSTVSGLQGGDVRFIAYDWPPNPDVVPFLPTDEQPNVSMAGDYLFGGHWEAGFAMRILDRSDSRGSFQNKIVTQRLDTAVTSQDDPRCPFSASHYCVGYLKNTREYDRGFYIYYGQDAVYDEYWSEYAVWVVSNDNLYFRSADGAILALTHGSPQTTAFQAEETASAAAVPGIQAGVEPNGVLAPEQAREFAGSQAVVSGRLEYVFNNGKQVLLGFSNPHRGNFKIIVRKADWGHFSKPVEEIYRVGQVVQVSGLIEWYQGDPVIYAKEPAQIIILSDHK